MYRRELIETQVIKQAAMHGTWCLKIEPVKHETRYVDNSSVEWFGFEMKKKKNGNDEISFFFFLKNEIQLLLGFFFLSFVLKACLY